jgi:hypothetical protein
VRRPQQGGPHAGDLERLTGLAAAAQVRHDRGLASAVERGEGPRVGRGTPLGRLAAALCEAVGAGAAGRRPGAPWTGGPDEPRDGGARARRRDLAATGPTRSAR